MTIRETLAEGKRLLRIPSSVSFIDTPDLDAVLFMSEILRTDRTKLVVRYGETISEQDSESFFRFIARRKEGECSAYILGRKEFRNLEFSVNPQVLVPRPDTETLVEAALEYIDSLRETNTPDLKAGGISLLDLCTGSGAVAISLKNERPFLSISASDISREALETAAQNAARLLEDSIHLIQSDLFNAISGSFDIIVSNPPYVPSADIDTLANEVRREPRLALDGGHDGLELIKKIILLAPYHLLPGGVILLEAAPEQMPAIRGLLETNGFGGIRVHGDLAGRDRVISASCQ